MALRRATTFVTSLLKSGSASENGSLQSHVHGVACIYGSAGVSIISLRAFQPQSSLHSPSNSRGITTSHQHSLSASSAARNIDLPRNADGETIDEIRARIFGTHIGDGTRSGRKLLQNKLLGPALASYYPPDPTKADPMMLDLAAERAKLKLDRLKRRGKAPPKKGAGKRSKK